LVVKSFIREGDEMPQGWDQWGLVGAVVLAVLRLFGWLLKTSYGGFVSELAASRVERQAMAADLRETCRSFSETLGNHFHESATSLIQLNQALTQHITEQRTVFGELREAIRLMVKESKGQRV
jgi:hypothetical protein